MSSLLHELFLIKIDLCIIIFTSSEDKMFVPHNDVTSWKWSDHQLQLSFQLLRLSELQFNNTRPPVGRL